MILPTPFELPTFMPTASDPSTDFPKFAVLKSCNILFRYCPLDEESKIGDFWLGVYPVTVEQFKNALSNKYIRNENSSSVYSSININRTKENTR